jgi:hypothetical protein
MEQAIMTNASGRVFTAIVQALSFYDIVATDATGHANSVRSRRWARWATRQHGLCAMLMGCWFALCSTPAPSAYYTTSLGTALSQTSDCDDCFDEVAFDPGETFDYFGQTYDRLFVGANGYVTFGSGSTAFDPEPMAPRAEPPMIGVIWMDLDTRDDGGSNVFVNKSTPGQIVVTWDGSGRFSRNYSERAHAQLVLRSNQFVIPAGEGQIGLFYGENTSSRIASTGFSNGNPSVDDGDQQLHFGPASELADTQLWLAAPAENVQPALLVPEPGIPAALALGLLVLGMTRARFRVAQCRDA